MNRKLDKLDTFRALWCVLGVCIATMYFCQKCQNRPTAVVDNTISSTKTTIIYDTIEKEIIVEKLTPYKQIVPVVDTITITDTVLVLTNYFTERTYSYEYTDSNLAFNTDIIVHENEIQTLCIDYDLYKGKVFVEKTQLKQSEFQLAIGGGLATNFSHLDIQIGARFGIKRHNLIVDYGVIDKRLAVGYQYNIAIK